MKLNKIINRLKDEFKKRIDNKYIIETINIFNRYKLKKFLSFGKLQYENFEYNIFKRSVLNYLNRLKCSPDSIEYKFSESSKKGNLYSTIYAYLIKGLFDEISFNERDEFKNYIYSFQCEDGLFRDERLSSPMAETGDHWGWKHLAPHILSVLDYLKIKPKYDFTFIYKMIGNSGIEFWLERLEWDKNYVMVSNKVMNVGVLLQYSRDMFSNPLAKYYISNMQEWLLNNKLSKEIGLWGVQHINNIFEIAKGVYTTYHILPIFIYDNIDIPFIRNTIESILSIQNMTGGFGPLCPTNACEDIDAIYILSKFSFSDRALELKINKALRKSFQWVLSNRNRDGGFVFQRNSHFMYGDQPLLSSRKNESNIFATWFRVLSIAYITKRLSISEDFLLSCAPGYQF